jgi:hypothetical protein
MFYQYDPNDVIIVHGSLLIDGFAEGSMITVSKRERDFEMDAGAKGDVVMRRMRNPIGEIIVRLQAESPFNTLLAARHELSLKGLAVALPTMVKDLRKTAMYKSAHSIVQGVPDSDFGAESGVREWVFLCADLEAFVAGAIQVQ